MSFIYSNPSDTNYFHQAQTVIPGGVNSPVRAFNGVGGDPIFFQSACGAYLFTEDRRQFIDYVGSWGPMIAGHAHPDVIQAVCNAVQNGLGFGAPTQAETAIAKTIRKLMPSLQMVRFVNSGTEATMSALRLARAYTKRDKFIKFEGCYHGHADSFLVKAGSGMLTLGHPNSPGVTESLAKDTMNAEFNNLQQVEEILRNFGNQIAAIIVEPVAGNMNCITPADNFLAGLRKLCDDYGSVLIFDEVMTGFRVGLGGAQGVYNITPDLTTIGKIIGGGMPVGAFGGKREIMELLAPLGPVYQAGTLSGNPIGVSAGLATLNIIQEPGFFDLINEKTKQLINGFKNTTEKHHIPFQSNQAGGMFGFFVGAVEKVQKFSQVAQFVETYNKIFHLMLKQGIYLAPSAYESSFMSATHSNEDIQKTIGAFDYALKTLKL